MWVWKPIDLASAGLLRLLGEFKYELTSRFPMALSLDETCGTVESTFILVANLQVYPSQVRTSNGSVCYVYFMNTEYSARDLNLYCASLPLQPAEGVAGQKRVEVVGDVYKYKYKYKYLHIIKNQYQGEHKRSLHVLVGNQSQKLYWSFQATIHHIHATLSHYPYSV